ncbi:amino acid racemase [Pseudomonas sp. MPC6]|uniref:aspartate/glutamate racemase family protein n=1 Tax=unclassified Pseudomonas TaxID=196821 RepID=UPI0011102E63|nr:amino acid racemase [Pseudomonas sp. MPC6]QCY09532.1 amino acid racemase [Pseudomonas sp. MPC6]
MREKIVGIIGGMGPEATVDLMRRVIEATPAEDDADHIRMLIDNNPKIPSRIKALIEGTGESPAPCMSQMAKELQRQGADFLVIPCNTAHHYYGEVAASVSIPVINLIELTAKTVQIRKPGIRKIGLLASSALQKIELYEPWFSSLNIEVLYPDADSQAAVMQLIRDVKARRCTSLQIDAYNAAAKNLEAQGAECLVVACTELSVINNQLISTLSIYDAADILAAEIVRLAEL